MLITVVSMILNDVAGRNLLNKFLSLHILRIISVINLPTVRSGYSDFIVGAERAENRVEQSGAVSGSCRKTMERSAEREVAEREQSGLIEIGWSAERHFCRSHSTHIFCELYLHLFKLKCLLS